MVRAYVLIEMTAGKSGTLVNTLEGRQEISAVTRVTGPYDVVVMVKARDIEHVSDIVADSIHTLDGVVRTTTCVSVG